MSDYVEPMVESRRAARMSMQNRLQNWIRNRKFQMKLLNMIEEGKIKSMMNLMY